MKNLYDITRFEDRCGTLYLERGKIDRKNNGIEYQDVLGSIYVPANKLTAIFLGPGTSITHGAIELLADNNCLVCWIGEKGIRLYSSTIGGASSSNRLLHQARQFADDSKRILVARRMFKKRFGEVSSKLSIAQLRSLEGSRVRVLYKKYADTYGVKWLGRTYDEKGWAGSPCNRAISCANSCLYGLCHAAIISSGYSTAIGFIHQGKMLSFVYDIADLYKFETTVKIAFELTAQNQSGDIEKRTRERCKDEFKKCGLYSRIIGDIDEVLDVNSNLTEIPTGPQGQIVIDAD